MTLMQKVKVAATILGVLLPPVFTYLAARADSNEAKVRAQVAYEAMVDQVKELKSSVHELELANATFNGRVAELERVQAVRVGGQQMKEAPRPAPTPKPMREPPSFEDAVERYRPKK